MRAAEGLPRTGRARTANARRWGVLEVRLDKLTRSFGPVEAVREISLEIREGETFGLLGPNGAGKTTTLSMLSTLLTPSSGDAWIFGESLRRNVSQVKRIVGLAPQEISLYLDLTAEAVGLADYLTGLSKSIVFGAIIAALACYEGLNVRGGAEGVGRATTTTVVKCIVMLIGADCIFTAVFYVLEW